ncbi:hypothetical protein PA598K_05379, partial [Paenibacillus sp. 598K]
LIQTPRTPGPPLAPAPHPATIHASPARPAPSLRKLGPFWLLLSNIA